MTRKPLVTVDSITDPNSDAGAALVQAVSAQMGTKVNSATYTAGMAGKQDKATLGADVAADATVRAALVAPLPTVGSYTYNADGTIASDSDGNTYTWNADGTPATQTKDGVTRTFHWSATGTLTSVS